MSEKVTCPQTSSHGRSIDSLCASVPQLAAGPAANLLLAVLLYGLVNWMGQEQPQAIIAKPAQATLAERAGLLGGEQILSVQTAGADAAAVESFEALRWALMQAALNGRDVELIWQKAGGREQGQAYLPLSLQGSDLDQTALRQIGIEYPWSPAVLGMCSRACQPRKLGCSLAIGYFRSMTCRLRMLAAAQSDSQCCSRSSCTKRDVAD